MKEIWKEVVDFPDYEVSDMGNVRRKKSKRLLKPYTSGKGYLSVELFKDGKGYRQKVHRVVLATFEPITGMSELTVNHINEDKTDNRLDNLEWLTLADNIRYSQTRHPKGKKVKCIETGIIYKSVSEASRLLNIHHGNLCEASKGKRNQAGGFHWEYIKEN